MQRNSSIKLDTKTGYFEHRIDLGKFLKCNTIGINPFIYNHNMKLYEELYALCEKGKIDQIFEDIKIVYTYNFKLEIEEKIDISNLKVDPFYKLFFNCKIPLIINNTILPHKKAYLIIKTYYPLKICAYITEK